MLACLQDGGFEDIPIMQVEITLLVAPLTSYDRACGPL
jgi:hypothetical protein